MALSAPDGAGSNRSNVIELPDLIQNLGQSGRTGLLRVHHKGQQVGVYFRGGMVVASDTMRKGTLSRALTWTGQVAPGGWTKLGIPEPMSLSDRELGELMVELGTIPVDGLRDAVDCHIEECFTNILGWHDAKYDFDAEAEPSDWAAYQAELGTTIASGSLLMEGLRRQDELKRVLHLVPATWDVLQREPREVGNLSPAEQRVIRAWREGRPAGAIMELSGLPPWDSAYATGSLIEHGLFRKGDGNELVVFGDRARKDNHNRTAEGLYRRALELGASAARIQLALGELAEARGDHKQAGADYVASAENAEASDPSQAVLALRNALRLGIEREKCLRKLLDIYQRLEENDDVLDTLFELAQFYEGKDRIVDAMEAVRMAQRLGADQMRCAQVLAALALLVDDQDEAILNLEQVITACRQAGKIDEANTARRQMLMIAPGRSAVALDFANHLAQGGERESAAKILRETLLRGDRTTSEEIDIAMHQLLAELDPHATASRDWLANILQKRKDREGAAGQLEKLAESQERDNDLRGAIDTLNRLLELGGDQADTHRRLAQHYREVGLLESSRDAWLAAIAALDQAGEQEQAQAWAEEAVASQPISVRLRMRAGELTMAVGQGELAELHYACAVRLAICSGDQERMRNCFDRFRSVAPDSLWIRMEVFELAKCIPFAEREAFLQEFVDFAYDRGDLRLALEAADLWATITDRDAFDPRARQVELLLELEEAQRAVKVGRALADDLVAAGNRQRAVELLEVIAEEQRGHADLVVHLGGLYQQVGRDEDAVEALRQGVQLMQQDERFDDVGILLDHLAELQPSDPDIERARQLLAAGEPINWQAIRDERAQASMRRIEADEGQGARIDRRISTG